MLEAPHQKPGGTFPSEWTWSTLESVCDAIFDCPHSTPKLKAGTNYLMARTQDVMTGVFRTDQAATVSADTYAERIKRAKPSTGDLLYSREGTYFGFAAEVPEATQVCLGQRMVLLRPNHKYIHHTFLRYWLNGPSMQRHIHGFRDGSVAERLNVSTIRQLPTALPPLPEQRRIAEILGALDDKIELNRKMNQTLEEMTQAIFKSWFIDFDGHTEFVDSELGKIPKGWRVAALRSVSSYLQRGIQPKYVETGGIPVINQKCIRDRRLSMAPSRRHDPELRSIDGRALAPGDVLVNSTGVGTLGRVATLPDDIGHVICDSHVTVVRADTALVSKTWLGQNMLHREAQIESLAQGSTGQTELSRTHLGEILLAVPPINLTQEFESTALPLKEKVRLNEIESETLAQLRNTLLPKLISGELRVPQAERTISEAV